MNAAARPAAGWRRWATFGLTIGRALTRDLEAALAGLPTPPACLARLRSALARTLRAGTAPGGRALLRIFLDRQNGPAAAGWGFFLVERSGPALPVIEVFVYREGAAAPAPPDRSA